MTIHRVNCYPVPWDITTTFGHGASRAPEKIQSDFHQLDHMHPFQNRHFDIHFLESNKTIQSLQNTFCSDSHQIIDFLNNNKKLSNSLEDRLVEINHAGSKLNQIVYNDCSSYLKTSPLLLCGGEHGVGIGYVRALADQYSSFSILQIDAHLDCRVQYFGYDYSHASVMTHYSTFKQVNTVTQVGIRDYDQSELDYIKNSKTDFKTFFDYGIHKRLFTGVNWDTICNEVIDSLSDHVFISLDVDGLMSYLSPHTGTPVPGGLNYNQLVYLFEKLYKKKTCIGAELVEINTLKHVHLDSVYGAKLIQLMAGMLV